MKFASPYFAWAFLVLIPLIAGYVYQERRSRLAMRFSDTSLLKGLTPKSTLYLRHSLLVLRVAGISLLIIALMRPQKGTSFSEITTEGVDIMLVIDISRSMEGLDFKPKNRLAVAKEKMSEFINLRQHDRIGLTIFGGRSFTKCPLTLDYPLLLSFVQEINFDMMQEQGTAIGTAIATAANRIKDSKAKSKIMILATDGANNRGEISPLSAAEACAQLGIKIYTIGIGKKGMVDMPMQFQDPWSGRIYTQVQKVESDLDESTLRKVAETTRGSFFRAQNSEELAQIYKEIDALEKSEAKTRQYTTWDEKFYPFLLAGVLLLMVDFLMRHTRFRRIP